MAFRTLEPKDPDSSGIDYLFDLAEVRNGRGTKDELQEGEFIASVITFFSDDPLLNIDSYTITDNASSVQVTVSGGTLNTYASVTVRYQTTLNRIDDSSIRIFIQDK